MIDSSISQQADEADGKLKTSQPKTSTAGCSANHRRRRTGRQLARYRARKQAASCSRCFLRARPLSAPVGAVDFRCTTSMNFCFVRPVRGRPAKCHRSNHFGGNDREVCVSFERSCHDAVLLTQRSFRGQNYTLHIENTELGNKTIYS